MKIKALTPSISSLPAVAMSAWQQKIHASLLQPIYKGGKKPWRSKNGNAPMFLISALEEKKTRSGGGGSENCSRFNVMKHNICDRLRSGREDLAVIRAVQWCCCCFVDALVSVSLGPMKDELTRALLSHLPTAKAAHPGRGGDTFIPSLSWF